MLSKIPFVGKEKPENVIADYEEERRERFLILEKSRRNMEMILETRRDIERRRQVGVRQGEKVRDRIEELQDCDKYAFLPDELEDNELLINEKYTNLKTMEYCSKKTFGDTNTEEKQERIKEGSHITDWLIFTRWIKFTQII